MSTRVHAFDARNTRDIEAISAIIIIVCLLAYKLFF